ncbi:division/cell wall cluster transcriptional repressor MraZ [candidate division LCP-89 bacterium B3_LCP]|uniref:Transcriptional regulator MraZ n=1 Tax=candidate division LCP-89 bacterium B3_LCP TaxID=2012998 RepID=A0A532V2N4_UNCL8|nr:MAG: division/cell wall cluster transcriptional repressor MraZ [candidate division LCP-89 bacterium B3_LCP]
MSKEPEKKTGKGKSNPFPNSFTDEFLYTIDNRGRINFPAPFRRILSDASKDRVVIARGLDNCLLIYPRDVWEVRRKDFNPSPYASRNQRRLQRELLHGARESSFDSQGRISIPSRLMKLAKLEKEALIIGVGDWVEVWNPSVYEQYLAQTDQQVESILEDYANRSSSSTSDSTDK